jgi:UDP-N-acetylmuramyl pentapeptide synthase
MEDFWIVAHEDQRRMPVVDVRTLSWTRHGSVAFAVQNALMAVAIARTCGLAPSAIAAGLNAHDARPESMPGSFNIFSANGATIAVDRPTSSWFLRAPLRAAGNLGSGRHIRVVGPMLQIDTADLFDIGKLLGRSGQVVITHGHWGADRLHQFRLGTAATRVPPVFLQAADERSAITQSLRILRKDDVMLILAENPISVIRQITKRLGDLDRSRPLAASIQ